MKENLERSINETIETIETGLKNKERQKNLVSELGKLVSLYGRLQSLHITVSVQEQQLPQKEEYMEQAFDKLKSEINESQHDKIKKSLEKYLKEDIKVSEERRKNTEKMDLIGLMEEISKVIRSIKKDIPTNTGDLDQNATNTGDLDKNARDKIRGKLKKLIYLRSVYYKRKLRPAAGIIGEFLNGVKRHFDNFFLEAYKIKYYSVCDTIIFHFADILNIDIPEQQKLAALTAFNAGRGSSFNAGRGSSNIVFNDYFANCYIEPYSDELFLSYLGGRLYSFDKENFKENCSKLQQFVYENPRYEGSYKNTAIISYFSGLLYKARKGQLRESCYSALSFACEHRESSHSLFEKAFLTASQSNDKAVAAAASFYVVVRQLQLQPTGQERVSVRTQWAAGIFERAYVAENLSALSSDTPSLPAVADPEFTHVNNAKGGGSMEELIAFASGTDEEEEKDGEFVLGKKTAGEANMPEAFSVISLGSAPVHQDSSAVPLPGHRSHYGVISPSNAATGRGIADTTSSYVHMTDVPSASASDTTIITGIQSLHSGPIASEVVGVNVGAGWSSVK
jgi:hypothetical protein